MRPWAKCACTVVENETDILDSLHRRWINIIVPEDGSILSVKDSFQKGRKSIPKFQCIPKGSQKGRESFVHAHGQSVHAHAQSQRLRPTHTGKFSSNFGGTQGRKTAHKFMRQ